MTRSPSMSTDRDDPAASPTHIACIMDGNGRWAAQRSLVRADGHSAGAVSLIAAVDAALEAGTRWLTLFTFSSENWNRPLTEVDFLMRLNKRIIVDNAARWNEQKVRMRYLGATDPRIPGFVRDAIDHAQDLTRGNDRLTLTFALGHGGRRDLVHSVRSLLLAAPDPASIDEHTIAEHLEFPDMPDVDLLIRTSGEQRISNFLLWHLAYAEIVFLDVLWPDFRAEHLHQAIETYHGRQRRFGATVSHDREPSSA